MASATTIAPTTTTPDRAMTREVIATFGLFFGSGVIGGSWFSRIPAVKDHLDADVRTVGFVLLCLGLGSLLVMPFTGLLIERTSARAVCTAGLTGACLVYPLLPFIDNVWAFGLVLLLAGGCYGLWDVSINVHGADVERAYGRTIMSMLHGTWSLGLIVGSGIGALLAGADVSLKIHFPVVMLVLLAGGLFLLREWRPYRTEHTGEDAPGTDQGPHLKVLSLTLIFISLMTMCSTLGEGTASDWMALYLHDDHGFSAGLAASVYTVYTIALTIGRFCGSFTIRHLGRVRALRLSGLVSACGVLVMILSSATPAFYVGSALWGFGLAIVFPTAVTAVGELAGRNAARAISAVATISYGSFLAGPPLIGTVAQESSIGRALWITLVLALGISVLAFTTAPRKGTIQSA
ncbi:MAG TPA: MFS transporter [Thermomicrobiales bacterium]|nr:MFS transporter [Thermomicrobiales bacterium]